MDHDLPGRTNRWTDSRTQSAVLWTVLITVYFIYVASFVGVVGSNDGSHYAIVRSLIDQGTFRVDDALYYTCEDVATDRYPIPQVGAHRPIGEPEASASGRTGRLTSPARQGEPDELPRLPGEHFYSNKPPGTALLAVPLYAIGRVLEPWLNRYPPPDTRFRFDRSRLENPFFNAARKVGYTGSFAEMLAAYRREWQRQNCANLLPAAMGVLCTALVYRLCRHLGVGFAAALATAFVTAVGTIQWRYSTALFSHIVAAAMLLGLVDGVASGWAWRGRASTALWGLLLGSMVGVQYQMGMFLPVLAGYWIWRSRQGVSDGWRHRAVVLAISTIVPLVLLGAYHQICFGSPFVSAVSRSRYFSYASEVRGMLSGSPAEALQAVYIQAPNAPQIGGPALAQGPPSPTEFVQFPLLVEPTPLPLTERVRHTVTKWLAGWNPGGSHHLQGAGLLVASPFMIAAAAGWLLLGWRLRRPAGLVAVVLLMQLALVTFIREPTGGATYDARYLVTVIPLWAIGFGLLAQKISQFGQRWRGPARGLLSAIPRVGWAAVRWAFYGVLGILAVLSITNMLHSMAMFQRHEFGLIVLRRWPETRYDITWTSRLSACFQSISNTPLLLVATGVLLLAILAIWGGVKLHNRLMSEEEELAIRPLD